jgi:outer membrane protein assembly factor BamB
VTLVLPKEPDPPRPIRLWPGVVAAVLLVLAVLAVVVAPEATPLGMIGALVAGLAILVWWAFFSRAPRSDRWGAVLLIVAGVIVTRRFLHPSIAGAGMGMLFYLLAVPALGLVLFVWAVASRRLSRGPRRASMIATILLACGGFTLLRTSGVSGDVPVDLHWRWTPTPEERLLAREITALPAAPTAEAIPQPERPAQTGVTPASTEQSPEKQPVTRPGSDPVPATPVRSATETRAFWPGFRGPKRDGVVRGVRIDTDWAASPPVELWRRPIGPGWSSFAVEGDRLYSQEQRGEDEIVACYDARTGEPVWRHRDAARFWESNGGAGPRGTPTLSDGRVYAFGATGIVNALDARDGALLWSRDAASDTGIAVPYWGFASSPLVVGDLVVVAAAGKLVAYDTATGSPRWFGASGGGGYSSPHLSTIDGVTQILLLSGDGATSVAPADGALLWQHAWPGAAIVQPSLVADSDLLISTNDMSGGIGVRRIAVAHGPGGWTVEERWTSRGLKPYYNDFVAHRGHAYGFDGGILACLDLEDGKRKWKGGRYGHGQLVLLPDQDLLLVLSEEGELALAKAAPDQFTEIARVPAIEGKTWNHPVLVGDLLLVRNDQEMAAFRLALGGS